MNDSDLHYWFGKDIVEMPRSELQDALIAAKFLIMTKENELVKLRHFYMKGVQHETIDSNRFTSGAYLASFC